MKEDLYRDFAEVYDLFYQHMEDVEFYINICKKYGEPVLELACGTGRVLIPLAKAGLKVIGLDISDSMLKVLESKLSGLNKEIREKISFLKGDAREFSLDERFNTIIMPFSSIVHLLNVDDALKTFKNAYRHLNDGGAFIFDVFDPNLEKISKGKRIEFDVREIDDGKVIIWEASSYDLTKQLIHSKRYVIIETGEGRKEAVWVFTIRYYFKTELELLLRMAGFKKIEVYSGINLEPYSYCKDRMVFIAEK